MIKRLLILLAAVTIVQSADCQWIDSKYFDAMRWRSIGPHRGGRTVGASGVPQEPNVFYIGVNNGGVWKTNDYGRTWFPIFDDQPTGSIGDVAVAPSNPDVIYVGSGEGLQRPDLSVGDGMYKSTDAGKSWIHLGLREVQQIGGLAVDPRNENRVFVAALGHPYGPNPERGVYRSQDGGKNWEKVLYIDENTGAIQVAIDPNHPEIVFADLWASRLGPWENGQWGGSGSGLFKSTDGGTTWRKITKGLPTTDQGLGRIGFCIAPSDSRRMYATVDAGRYGGVYRSDDAGESWTVVNTDRRYWGRGDDFAEVKVDPKNPDIVYSANVVTWKSTDGGLNWEAFRGAPGGDDYHRIWINPDNPDILLIASDQGAIITVNGGQTFSSWYNQPTAQFYHVSTDNAFPYNVYSGQQESGSVGIASRGNDGEITFREWHPVGADEYGYVAPDPLDPDIIYGGRVEQYDKRTGQVRNVSPVALRDASVRFLRTAPLLFSPVDPKTLYFAGNVLFKTRDGGQSWTRISPDLTRANWDIPASVGIFTNEDMKTMPRRGVIYTIAPSYIDVNTIWCGTDDGLIQVTTDGGSTWKDVTPPGVTSWSKVSLMEAGHYDGKTAYAAVNRIRCDDMHPHIYRTNDGGRTWTEIVNGLPEDPINVVREDPVRKGLLFAGSERAVYVSFDDGDHWQSLKLNMPATSVRDLVIKDDDLVVGTHGRGFWILDDITPVRQIDPDLARQDVILYKPQDAWRVRWDMYTDTPLPQEEPAGQNPPDGAVIDYYLAQDQPEVTLEIRDASDHLVRRYSSRDSLIQFDPGNVPPYWIRPQQILPAGKGHHRYTWDLHYKPLSDRISFPIAAIYHNTAPNYSSPWVMPGLYKVTLTVGGQSVVKTFNVRMDPRVTTTRADLQKQFDLSMQCYEGALKCNEIIAQQGKATAENRQGISSGRSSIPGSGGGFSRLAGSFAGLMGLLQQADMPPTEQAVKVIGETQKEMDEFLSGLGNQGR